MSAGKNISSKGLISRSLSCSSNVRAGPGHLIWLQLGVGAPVSPRSSYRSMAFRNSAAVALDGSRRSCMYCSNKALHLTARCWHLSSIKRTCSGFTGCWVLLLGLGGRFLSVGMAVPSRGDSDRARLGPAAALANSLSSAIRLLTVSATLSCWEPREVWVAAGGWGLDLRAGSSTSCRGESERALLGRAGLGWSGWTSQSVLSTAGSQSVPATLAGLTLLSPLGPSCEREVVGGAGRERLGGPPTSHVLGSRSRCPVLDCRTFRRYESTCSFDSSTTRTAVTTSDFSSIEATSRADSSPEAQSTRGLTLFSQERPMMQSAQSRSSTTKPSTVRLNVPT